MLTHHDAPLMNAMPDTPVLFARSDSIYKSLGCDVYDADRDALTWPGGRPCIAHPPCRLWGRLRQFSKAPDSERALAHFAVAAVRENGGVLEHPAYSTLWPSAGLPLVGAVDKYGGWTLPILQFWFGHRAMKATWLYIVGCKPRDLPPIPLVMGESTHCINQGRRRIGVKPEVTKREREHTPESLAHWLIDVASRCHV